MTTIWIIIGIVGTIGLAVLLIRFMISRHHDRQTTLVNEVRFTIRFNELIATGDWIAVVKMGDAAVGSLRGILDDDDVRYRKEAAKALLQIGTRNSVSQLLITMRRADEERQRGAVSFIKAWMAFGPASIALHTIVDFAVAQKRSGESSSSILQLLHSIRDEFPEQVDRCIKEIDEQLSKQENA